MFKLSKKTCLKYSPVWRNIHYIYRKILLTLKKKSRRSKTTKLREIRYIKLLNKFVFNLNFKRKGCPKICIIKCIRHILLKLTRQNYRKSPPPISFRLYVKLDLNTMKGSINEKRFKKHMDISFAYKNNLDKDLRKRLRLIM